MDTTLALPDWVEEIRPHQTEAVEQILDAYEAGAQVVFLDAPTGTGKTLIAEIVRQRLDTRAVYVCSGKSLQQQFLHDFPDAKLLQGRANYTPQHPYDSTCDDCLGGINGAMCHLCDSYQECPYQKAKRVAAKAELAVLNTAYFYAVTNYGGEFQNNDFVVLDEADAAEDSMLNFVEFAVPQWIGRRLRLDWPIKAARKTTLIKWLGEIIERAQPDEYMQTEMVGKNKDIEQFVYTDKDARSFRAFVRDCDRVIDELQIDVDAAKADEADDTEDNGHWMRDYDTKTFAMKPIMVAPYGTRNLWSYGKRWLLMSATIVSAEEMANSLGLTMEWAVVKVPMTFPIEHRRIIIAPVANVTMKSTDDDYANLAFAVEQIIAEHPGERVLVHTVSYALTKRLVAAVKVHGRRKFHYSSAYERDIAIKQYREHAGAVLFAPSLSRGLDLKDDECRVQIIAKCPFPSFGDKRVGQRMRMPGGQLWYAVSTVRDIVQMTGRGVRSVDDHCTTYILDAQFTRNVWLKHRHLFPLWWREAVDTSADVRRLVRSRR